MKSLQKLIDIEKYLLKLERKKKNSFGADSESSSRRSSRNTNNTNNTFNCDIKNDHDIINKFREALYDYIPKNDRSSHIEAKDLDGTVYELKELYLKLLEKIDSPDDRDDINGDISTIYDKITYRPKLWYYSYFSSLTKCIQNYIDKLNETPTIEPKPKREKKEKNEQPTDLPLESIYPNENWNKLIQQSIKNFDRKTLNGYHIKLITLLNVIDQINYGDTDSNEISNLIELYFIDTQRRWWNGLHVKIQKLYVKSLYDPIINKYKTLNPDNNNISLSSNVEVIVNNENPETVKIDLYDIYKENYYGTGFDDLPSPDFDLRKQLKWLICFCILFYIDSLHDFYSEVDNGENFKTHIKDRFDAFIIQLVNNFKIKLEGEETDFIITIEEALIYGLYIAVINNRNILASTSDTRWYREYDNGDFTDVYAELEVYLYYTEYSRNVRNTNNSNITNTNSRLKRTRTNNNNTKYPNYILRSQDSLVVCSEYLIAIMGVQKINLKAFQKTITGSNNSKHHNIIIKLISHINSLENDKYLDTLEENNEMGGSNFIINTLVNDKKISDNDFPYTIGVDALSKVEKRSPVTSIISDSIELGNQNTYIDSFISTLDGASTDNSIKTKLKSLNQRIIYHDFSKLTFDINFTDIPIMKFIYIKERGEPKMIITNYFGFEIPDGGLTGNKDEYYPKTGTVNKGIIKKNNTISIKSIIDKINIYNNPTKYNYTIFKTLLDFSKILHFWSYNNYRVVPTVINSMQINRTDHHLFLLNDVLAANMSALFIKNTCVEETAEIIQVGLDERHYWLFLRSYMLKKIWKDSQFKNNNIVSMNINPVNIGAFGKSKNFIKVANEKSVKNGTIGTFGKWCRSNGLASADGKVTKRCIKSAKKSRNTTLIRRAIFAQNIGGYKGANKNNKKLK